MFTEADYYFFHFKKVIKNQKTFFKPKKKFHCDKSDLSDSIKPHVRNRFNQHIAK